MTQYKIYKLLCNELGIMFPFKESELTTPVNPIPNTLEFDIKNAKDKMSRDEIETRRLHRAKAYYSVYKDLGSEKFEELNKKKANFNLKSSEHPDRYVNLHTIISILFLSGYRGKELVKKSIDYLNN